MKEKSCCFTGHRNIPAEELHGIVYRTEEHIRGLINDGVASFYVGGALGYDTIAAKLLFDLRDKEFPQIRVILSYPFDGFTDSWSVEQQTQYVCMLAKYNEIVKVSTVNNRAAYLARDRYMVDHAAYCICYCTKKSGGTAYTVRYAQKQGVPVFNVAE